MPTKIEKDAITGQVTTGHEWDGLRELNRPLPTWWLYVFFACVVWAVGFCVLYPSVPGTTGYFHGVIGYYQRDAVDADVAAVARQRAGVMDHIKALSFADIRKDPQLLAVAGKPPDALPSRRIVSRVMAPAAAGTLDFRLWQPVTGCGAASSRIFNRPSLSAFAAASMTRAIAMMPRFGADGILKPGGNSVGRRLRGNAVRVARNWLRPGGRQADLCGQLRRLSWRCRAGHS